MIDDPTDAKPEDWDQPEQIADPDAKKPVAWNDDMDGEWKPDMIDNPDYKGEWKPRQISNPNYKGKKSLFLGLPLLLGLLGLVSVLLYSLDCQSYLVSIHHLFHPSSFQVFCISKDC